MGMGRGDGGQAVDVRSGIWDRAENFDVIN